MKPLPWVLSLVLLLAVTTTASANGAPPPRVVFENGVWVRLENGVRKDDLGYTRAKFAKAIHPWVTVAALLSTGFWAAGKLSNRCGVVLGFLGLVFVVGMVFWSPSSIVSEEPYVYQSPEALILAELLLIRIPVTVILCFGASSLVRWMAQPSRVPDPRLAIPPQVESDGV